MLLIRFDPGGELNSRQAPERFLASASRTRLQADSCTMVTWCGRGQAQLLPTKLMALPVATAPGQGIAARPDAGLASRQRRSAA